jgi:hypothetical protein
MATAGCDLIQWRALEAARRAGLRLMVRTMDDRAPASKHNLTESQSLLAAQILPPGVYIVLQAAGIPPTRFARTKLFALSSLLTIDVNSHAILSHEEPCVLETAFMKNSELTKKINEICKAHGIKIHWMKFGKNRANRKEPTIWVDEISDSGDFAAALHEIGHAMCDPDTEPRTDAQILTKETNAWQWALEQNGNNFDEAGWKRLHKSLHEYYVSARDMAHPAHALLVRAEETVPTIRKKASIFGAPLLHSSPKKNPKPQS